jgi:hypothetical protein
VNAGVRHEETHLWKEGSSHAQSLAWRLSCVPPPLVPAGGGERGTGFRQRPRFFSRSMPLTDILSEESLAQAQLHLEQLRAHGDLLQSKLSAKPPPPVVRSAWTVPPPQPCEAPASPSVGRHCAHAACSPSDARRSVARNSEFAVGNSGHFDAGSFRAAIAAEDAAVTEDLRRMRLEAEHEAARREAEQAHERQRADVLSRARSDLAEAARERDVLKRLSLLGGSGSSSGPADAVRAARPRSAGAPPLDLEPEEDLPLSALADQTRTSLRRAREQLDAQRHSARPLSAATATRPASAGRQIARQGGVQQQQQQQRGQQQQEQARARAQQELAIAEDGGWFGWKLGIGSLAPTVNRQGSAEVWSAEAEAETSERPAREQVRSRREASVVRREPVRHSRDPPPPPPQAPPA